jgi:hypothetical protein
MMDGNDFRRAYLAHQRRFLLTPGTGRQTSFSRVLVHTGGVWGLRTDEAFVGFDYFSPFRLNSIRFFLLAIANT